MLYVSAGMDKAGTTYTYNLLKLLLKAAGHQYIHLSREVRGDPSAKERGANNIWEWSAEVVENLRQADVARQIIALRTHAAPSAAMLDLLISTGGKAHAIVRDPRDLALSMMDVVRKLEAAGKSTLAREKEVTRDVRLGDFPSTFPFLHRNIKQVSQWADFGDSITLFYEDNGFRPAASLRKICDQLGLDVPEERFEVLAKEAGENPNGKRNVAQPMRHTREMDAGTQTLFLREFRPFYERFFPEAL